MMGDGWLDGSGEDALLRSSVRALLARHWPAETAVEQGGRPDAVAAVWRELAANGFAALDDLGLRETLILFEEAGRAACPAPLLGALAANALLPGADVVREMHAGAARIAVALAGFDGDASAGTVTVGPDGVSGVVSFVEGAASATHFLVFVEDAACLVAQEAARVTVTETPGLAVPALAQVRFDHAPCERFQAPASEMAEVAAVIRLAAAARALGAAQRAFDMAVDHAKLRRQFGQLIGQFQALQHKLANGLISLDGSRVAIEAAAAARDAGNPEWPAFAAAALAFAGPALRAVSLATHGALGAIGYAEEHEAPRHFRRVHADLARFGGAPKARADLAAYYLGPLT
jgi:acyl-CoA dehydrogenase